VLDPPSARLPPHGGGTTGARARSFIDRTAPDVVKTTRSRRVKWAGHVARMRKMEVRTKP
jgi:hypothetical protein